MESLPERELQIRLTFRPAGDLAKPPQSTRPRSREPRQGLRVRLQKRLRPLVVDRVRLLTLPGHVRPTGDLGTVVVRMTGSRDE